MSHTTVQEVIDYLHSIAPNHYQESYDNSGLLVGLSDQSVTGVLVSLDVTEAIIEEAISLGCNMIVSHHPIIFSGLKRITDSDYVQRIVRKAIKADINLFAIHTNLDNVYNHGVNTHIGKILGLQDVSILRPKDPSLGSDIGSGIVGTISPITERDFLSHLKTNMALTCIKHTDLLGKKITKVAVCGGSGRFLLPDAIASGADVFISSDFKYHEFFDADGDIVIADIGHYESEQFTTDMIYKLIKDKFTTFAPHYTKIVTNPVNYYF